MQTKAASSVPYFPDIIFIKIHRICSLEYAFLQLMRQGQKKPSSKEPGFLSNQEPIKEPGYWMPARPLDPALRQK